jgi:ribosome-binding protein aMBF1 (putative translation factor)
MNLFKEQVTAHRAMQAQRFTDRIERINARLDHMDQSSDAAEILREERARLWWRRNDLYRKMQET